MFQFTVGFGQLVMTSGVATIDAGDGNETKVRYDSVTKLIDDYVAKGWTLMFVTSLGPAALLVFEKK